MKKYNYIIVGQGLAGTLLAYFLLQAGQRVLIIDENTEGGASAIAAGVINPVTGRRIVKSWRIDEFLPFAKNTYQSIENQYHHLDQRGFQAARAGCCPDVEKAAWRSG